ncbi:CaiB/BaiF CoA transferase family protein [Aromatoleum petrolei]|uniref:CoA transferase n=1 Tax=Aromatoleum petrolei TaxID=76116 RepID=A0ABX1MN59_9RHOO|nr:CoA transferase [Aromatoleum petrolei]NMF88641.1 CoA transferase [Aromatoleum petrolei]
MLSRPDTSSAAATGPLAGIRVVDLSINVLGPVATQILGDMGADVIKVETPQGDPNRDTGPARHPGMSAMHMNLNRNKRSITLNLKNPDAKKALMRLVETADVVVHSMRPAAAVRLGISYSDISAKNDRIIYAYGPGYRQDGPKKDLPAFDDVVQSESGIAALMGQVNGEPRYYPTVIIDKFCGYILASSIGMALFARERTGKGQEVHVPMFETILSFNYLEHLWGGAFDPPLDPGVGYVRLLTRHRRPYPTKDGYIGVLAVNDDQWRRMLPALGRPELVNDTRFATTAHRVRHYDELYGIVAEQLKLKTTAEWYEIFDAIDIPNGPMNSLQDLLHDRYLAETGFFHRYTHPTEGPAVTTSVPVHFSETPGSIRLPPPLLGEHNHAVLSELGYSTAEIHALST